MIYDSQTKIFSISDLPEGRIESKRDPKVEFILDVIVDSPLEKPS